MTGRDAAEKALAERMANGMVLRMFGEVPPGSPGPMISAFTQECARIACDAIEKAIIAYAAEPGRGVPWDAIAGEEGGE